LKRGSYRAVGFRRFLLRRTRTLRARTVVTAIFFLKLNRRTAIFNISGCHV
jgi:hypothetical protein